LIYTATLACPSMRVTGSMMIFCAMPALLATYSRSE
jgi:hypothetical protein